VTEVLGYVQYEKQELTRRMRRRLEEAVRARRLNMKESALLMRRYEEGLAAYTYLVDDDAELGEDEPAAAVADPRRGRDSAGEGVAGGDTVTSPTPLA
jgi:hypothetical protein